MPPRPRSSSPVRSQKHSGCAAQWGGAKGTARLMSYRCVVEDDVAARHVAVENVLLQVLNERPLQRRGGTGRWIFRFVLHTSIHFAPNEMLKDAMDQKNILRSETPKSFFSYPKSFLTCLIIIPQ